MFRPQLLALFRDTVCLRTLYVYIFGTSSTYTAAPNITHATRLLGQKHNVTPAEHICAHSDLTSKRQPIGSVCSNSGLLAGGQYEFPGSACQWPNRQCPQWF